MASPNSRSTGQPLFLVDHDWLRQDSKSRKSWTGNVRNRSLYGLAIEVSEHGPSIRHDQSVKKSRKKRRSKLSNDQDSDSTVDQDQPSRRQSIASTHSTSLPTFDNAGHLFKDADSGSISRHAASDSENSTLFNQQSGFGGSAENLPFDQDICLQNDMDRCIDMLVSSQRPTDTQFFTQANAAARARVPSIFVDNVWLRKMAMFSALDLQLDCDVSQVNPIVSSLLSQLSQRIQIRDLSKVTIVSAANLSLAEHLRDNEDLATVHANGLAQLIRIRGGLASIDHLSNLEIARADIIRSVDNLHPPLLQRPSDVEASVTKETLTLDRNFAVLLREVANNVSSSAIIASLWTLKGVCQDIESVIDDLSSFGAVSYYENLLCLNHDLLSLTTPSGYEEILRLAILDFVQPMYRFGALNSSSCRRRSTRLRAAIEATDLRSFNRTVLLWVFFLGFMFSEGTSENTFFKQCLESLLDENGTLQEESWLSLRTELRRFVWIDCIHDVYGQHFYEKLRRYDLA